MTHRIAGCPTTPSDGVTTYRLVRAGDASRKFALLRAIAVAGAATGAVLGSLVGLASSGERWERIDISAATGVRARE